MAVRRFRYTLPGAWVALVFAWLSFVPSLLPRPPEFQGLVVGVDAAIGYGLGVLGAFVWREFADRPPRTPRPGAWRAYAVTWAVGGPLVVLVGERWQRELRELVGLPGVNPFRLVLIPVIAAAVFVLLVALGRAFRSAYHVGEADGGVPHHAAEQQRRHQGERDEPGRPGRAVTHPLLQPPREAGRAR